MKLVTYSYEDQDKIGAMHDDAVVDLTSIAPTMLALIEKGPEALTQARAVLESVSETLPLDSVKLNEVLSKEEILDFQKRNFEHREKVSDPAKNAVYSDQDIQNTVYMSRGGDKKFWYANCNTIPERRIS